MHVLLFIVPVLSTLAGGLLAVRLRAYMHVLLGFGAGLLLGAAFLDLLPEALSIGSGAGIAVTTTLAYVLLSFLTFFVVESGLESLASGQDARLPRRTVGRLAGGLLIFHSLRDGMAIGAAFTASHAAGYAVAMGIGAHDLGDGMNSILLTTAGDKPQRVDYAFLVADALAPLLGGALAMWWFASARNSVALLAVAAGFFLQMAAGDFLPQARRTGTGRLTTVAALLAGVAVIYGANMLLGKFS